MLVAGLIALAPSLKSHPPRLSGALGEAAALLLVGLLCLFLLRARGPYSFFLGKKGSVSA